MQATGHIMKKRLLTDINMIPFIDVVLVLLIIFMVMSPFLVQSQIQVNLPQAVAVTPAASDAPVKVQVTRQGVVHVNGRAAAKSELDQILRSALLQSKDRTVLIEADKGVAFQHVVAVLDAAERLEAGKVGVAALPVAEPEPSAK
ncbi:MAG: ExbD/TolR family protein [Elusimicrobiota bacterium]